MSPVSFSSREVVYAKDQPEYLPLPAERWKDGTVVTKWSLTWREKWEILRHGAVFLSMLTFHQPLQPVRLSVYRPEETRRVQP